MRQRWRRHRSRSAKPLWIGGALAVVAVSAAWVTLGTSVLGVRRVEVTGATIAGADQVRAAAAVVDGTPLARVDTDAVSDRVRTLPSVARAEVSRSWPGTLVIAVTERVPAAVVAIDGGYLVIDAEGVVFNQVSAPLEGVVTLRVAAPGPDDPATRAGLRVVAALTAELRAQLVEVVAESADRIRLELANSRVVIWGDAEQSERKAQVATTLLAQPVTTIDVSAPEVATTD